MSYHAAMLSASLIVEARRRAGLSQRALAKELGIAQPGIARLESGREQPSLERLRAIVAACGLQLTIGVEPADDSYDAPIRRALQLTPAQRLARRLRTAERNRAARAFAQGAPAPGPLDVVGALRAVAAAGGRFVVVGEIAETLHGSPIVASSGTVTIVPRPGDRVRLVGPLLAGRGVALDEPSAAHVDAAEHWQLQAFGVELAIVPAPAGTAGYADLARDAQPIALAEDLTVEVASLVDLVRIAQAAPLDAPERARAIALRRTLELTHEPLEDARAA